MAHDAGERTEAPRTTSPEPPPRVKESPVPTGPFAKIYVSIGQAAGAQPGDIVGAITGETKLDGSAIGAVKIEERYSLVEVREDRADQVLKSMKGTSIKGPADHRQPVRDGQEDEETAAAAERRHLARGSPDAFLNQV